PAAIASLSAIHILPYSVVLRVMKLFGGHRQPVRLPAIDTTAQRVHFGVAKLAQLARCLRRDRSGAAVANDGAIRRPGNLLGTAFDAGHGHVPGIQDVTFLVVGSGACINYNSVL